MSFDYLNFFAQYIFIHHTKVNQYALYEMDSMRAAYYHNYILFFIFFILMVYCRLLLIRLVVHPYIKIQKFLDLGLNYRLYVDAVFSQATVVYLSSLILINVTAQFHRHLPILQVNLDYTRQLLTLVSGQIRDNNPVIQSLMFKSNIRKHGPFGREEGRFFSCALTCGKIIGFRGRSGAQLDALGVPLNQFLIFDS